MLKQRGCYRVFYHSWNRYVVLRLIWVARNRGHVNTSSIPISIVIRLQIVGVSMTYGHPRMKGRHCVVNNSVAFHHGKIILGDSYPI